MSKEHIQDVVLQSLQEYFKDLDGQKPTDIYNMIMHTVEKPVLVAVMAHARNNQSMQPKYSASTETRFVKNCLNTNCFKTVFRA